MTMPTRRAGVPAADLRLLRRLCEAVAVSGDEGEVRKIILQELEPAAADYKVDAVGNLLITKHGRSPRPLRVMLDAHMDEVGFMVVAEDGEGQGLYELEKIGGLDVGSLVGKAVVVGSKKMPGVVGVKPIHMTTEEERKRPIAADGLRIDLGPGGKAKLGDRGTFAPDFRRTGPSVMSKALDNRLGVATLIELVKAMPGNLDAFAAFTVQEEIGLRGAKVAANYFKPDLAIIIDATPANDLPMQYEGENTFYNSRLGLGPAIYVSERSTIDDPRLVRFLMDTATRAKIPFQIRQPGGGGTDAGAIQRSAAGVPVVGVSIPHRYTHSAMSIARIEDWQNTKRLLVTALRNLTPEVLRSSK
jgi:putative aminopeptidase FrvX